MSAFYGFTICFVIFCKILTEINAQNETFAPIVTTKSGKVRGVVKDLADGTQFYLYQGIPFGNHAIGLHNF